MTSNDEKGVDPTVKTIVELFPEEFLRNAARETGVVRRERKVDLSFKHSKPVVFWMTN